MVSFKKNVLHRELNRWGVWQSNDNFTWQSNDNFTSPLVILPSIIEAFFCLQGGISASWITHVKWSTAPLVSVYRYGSKELFGMISAAVAGMSHKFYVFQFPLIVSKVVRGWIHIPAEVGFCWHRVPCPTTAEFWKSKIQFSCFGWRPIECMQQSWCHFSPLWSFSTTCEVVCATLLSVLLVSGSLWSHKWHVWNDPTKNVRIFQPRHRGLSHLWLLQAQRGADWPPELVLIGFFPHFLLANLQEEEAGFRLVGVQARGLVVSAKAFRAGNAMKKHSCHEVHEHFAPLVFLHKAVNNVRLNFRDSYSHRKLGWSVRWSHM